MNGRYTAFMHVLRCLCLPSLLGLLASISNLPVISTALSKSAFNLALFCCSWAIVVVASLAEVTLFGLQECGQRQLTKQDTLNGHQCYDEVNIFDGQQVVFDFAILIFFQIFQSSDYSGECRPECIQCVRTYLCITD